MEPAPGGYYSSLLRTQRRGLAGRTITMVASAVVAFLLLAFMLVMPVPYVVEGPGPTFNTLGKVSDHELITIDGATSYPSDGQLRLTTVSTFGGPGFRVSAGTVLRGWLSGHEVVQPVEALFPPGLTESERQQVTTQQMSSSQRDATVAALTSMGYKVPAKITIVGAVAHSDANTQVKKGDKLVAIKAGGQVTKLKTYADLAKALAPVKPSEQVTMVVNREGKTKDLKVTTGSDGNGKAMLGIYLDVDFDFPIKVDIEIDNVGGPSAGTMFALGIIDKLTPGSLTGGHVVAGTGTMSPDGEVGPIGGIQLKMLGAHRDGAEYFLAPAANCDEVVGHVPDGLTVIKMSTLKQARADVEAIASGKTDGLPSCAD